MPEFSDLHEEVIKSEKEFIDFYIWWCDLYAKFVLNLS